MTRLTPSSAPKREYVIPKPSGDLDREIMMVEGASQAYGYQPSRQLQAVAPEARELLAFYEAHKVPPDKEHIAAWLLPIVRVVKNPPSQTEFGIYVDTMVDVLNDTPAVMLTKKSQVNAIRDFDFWPAPAEIYKFLLPDTHKFYKRRYALMEIVNQASAD